MLAHWFLSAVMFTAAIAIGVIVITSKMNMISKVLVIAALVFSSLFTYRALNDVYGYPIILQKNFDDALVLSHMLNKEKKVIHMWIKSPDEENPRSYTIPYEEKLASFLERMRHKHKGKPYRAKIETQSNPMSPLKQSIKRVNMGELIIFPSKL